MTGIFLALVVRYLDWYWRGKTLLVVTDDGAYTGRIGAVVARRDEEGLIRLVGYLKTPTALWVPFRLRWVVYDPNLEVHICRM